MNIWLIVAVVLTIIGTAIQHFSERTFFKSCEKLKTLKKDGTIKHGIHHMMLNPFLGFVYLPLNFLGGTIFIVYLLLWTLFIPVHRLKNPSFIAPWLYTKNIDSLANNILAYKNLIDLTIKDMKEAAAYYNLTDEQVIELIDRVIPDSN